jgi:hypothetical protein
MTIRDIFIDQYFYKELKNDVTHPTAFTNAVLKWEFDKKMIAPFNNHEAMRSYLYRRVNNR